MPPLHPWIQDYLISIAEQYGVDYFNAPPHEKSRTVQIIEFLHRGSEDQDANIWARISDSTRSITVKFLPEAANEYKCAFGKGLTDYRTAIIRIKDFRPFIGRVAIGENKMSSNETLALECKSATLRGNLGERILGVPISITSDRLIKMWIDGLNHGGGEGNILKQRRMEQENKNLLEKICGKDDSPLEQQGLDAVVRKSKVIQATRTNSMKTNSANETKVKSWKPGITSTFDVAPDIWATLKALQIEIIQSPLEKLQNEVDDHRGSPRKRSCSDIGHVDHKSSSRKKVRTGSIAVEDIDAHVEENDERSSQPLSDWLTSEQEDDIDDELLTLPPDPPPVPDGLPMESEQIDAIHTQRHSFSPRSSSSLLPMSVIKTDTPTSPSMSAPKIPHSQERSHAIRKVPPPKQPQEWTQASGQERVLAPASDTSMSQPQSQYQQHHETYSPGFAVMQVPKNAEDTSLVEEMTKTTRRSANRPVARKSSSSQSLSKPHNLIIDQSRDKEQSRVNLNSDTKGVSDHNPKQVFGGGHENERFRSDMEFLPSKKSSATKSHAEFQLASTPDITSAEKETTSQHDPVTWSRPSFMEESNTKTKLGRLEAELTGLRRSGEQQVGWLTWRELGRILSES